MLKVNPKCSLYSLRNKKMRWPKASVVFVFSAEGSKEHHAKRDESWQGTPLNVNKNKKTLHEGQRGFVFSAEGSKEHHAKRDESWLSNSLKVQC